MTARRTLDVSSLPPYDISSQAPLWWGQLMLAAIEGTTFFILIAIYFYMRLSVDVWPPPGTQLPHTLLPSIALVPLFLSAPAAYWASEAAKRNDRGKMVLWLVANVVLGFAFIVVRAAEVATFNFTWRTDAHGTIVWSILFLHTLDAVADLLFTVVLIVIIASGRYGEKQRLGVHVDSVVWYFIVLIWIPLYVVVYWGPHLVGAP